MSIHSQALRLVHSEPAVPHPTAQRVIEILGNTAPPADMPIRAVRHRYNLARRQFLAELEPVESVFHILPAERGVPRLTVIRPHKYQRGRLGTGHCLSAWWRLEPGIARDL